MEILQQTAFTVPSPVHSVGEVRGLLEKDGRGSVGIWGREG